MPVADIGQPPTGNPYRLGKDCCLWQKREIVIIGAALLLSVLVDEAVRVYRDN